MFDLSFTTINKPMNEHLVYRKTMVLWLTLIWWWNLKLICNSSLGTPMSFWIIYISYVTWKLWPSKIGGSPLECYLTTHLPFLTCALLAHVSNPQQFVQSSRLGTSQLTFASILWQWLQVCWVSKGKGYFVNTCTMYCNISYFMKSLKIHSFPNLELFSSSSLVGSFYNFYISVIIKNDIKKCTKGVWNYHWKWWFMGLKLKNLIDVTNLTFVEVSCNVRS